MKRKVTKNIKDFFEALKYVIEKAKEVKTPNKTKMLWKAK